MDLKGRIIDQKMLKMYRVFIYCSALKMTEHKEKLKYPNWIVSHLPGGHLPPPKFGHLPLPNSDISHPQKPNICQEDNCHPQFFFSFFLLIFLGFFDFERVEKEKSRWLIVDDTHICYQNNVKGKKGENRRWTA